MSIFPQPTIKSSTQAQVNSGIDTSTFLTPATFSGSNALAMANGLIRPRSITPAPIFTRTAAATISINSGVYVTVAGKAYQYVSATAVTMPSMVAGTDYFIHVLSDFSLVANTSTSPPSGYTTSTSRLLGGFHFNGISSILAASIWDLGFRPACSDPRGMVLVPGGGVWADIYLLNTDPEVQGTSRSGVTIADGSSPPTIPTAFGGTGSNRYSGLMRYEAAEVLRAFGKRPPRYEEFSAFAYGSTEAASCGTDPVTTGRTSGFTGLCGGEQATGCMWIWGAEFSYFPADSITWDWRAVTNGRGSVYTANNPGLVAAVFGGSYGDGARSGSRASVWLNTPRDSAAYLGARGFCDHLNLGLTA